jgi:hypothetical protein
LTKTRSVRRWDLLLGASASAVAIVGLLLNISAGNTDSAGFGSVDRETQKTLAGLAGVFLVLVLVKTGIRFRDGLTTMCFLSWQRGTRRRRCG